MLELADRHDLGTTKAKVNVKQLLNEFIASRRQGLSPNTIAYYRQCLTPSLLWHELTPQSITEFLAGLPCNAGGKLAYYRATRAFCNWLVRNDYMKESPLKRVDPPKPPKPILPSQTREQVDYLIAHVDNVRDKAIISMFFDSGMRLNELVNIKVGDIDWEDRTVTIWGKGNKQRRAPFTDKTADLLRETLRNDGTGENVWGIGRKGIEAMLTNLKQRTGLPCNPHSFRRGFACNLHREGLSTLDIMHLGGWQDLSMVLRYTRSITFDDCLKHYRAVLN